MGCKLLGRCQCSLSPRKPHLFLWGLSGAQKSFILLRVKLGQVLQMGGCQPGSSRFLSQNHFAK